MIIMDNLTPQGRSVGKVRPNLRKASGQKTLKGTYLTTMKNKYKGPKPRNFTSWA